MTTRNVLPSFCVDIQARRKCFTLILKDFLLCIEPNAKIQIIVSGFCLDVPNNKILVVAQLFLADKEGFGLFKRLELWNGRVIHMSGCTTCCRTRGYARRGLNFKHNL